MRPQGWSGGRIVFEQLETRLLLSGDVFAIDLAAELGSDDLDVTVILQSVDTGSGTVVDRFQVIDNKSKGPNKVIAERDKSEVGEIRITGGSGNDKITIDFSRPFALAKGIRFVGGPSSDPGTNSLLIDNGNFERIIHRVGDGTSNVVFSQLGLGDLTIEYSSFDEVADNASATDRVFEFGAADEEIVLSDGGAAGDGVSTISSTSLASGPSLISFAAPDESGTLMIDAGGGDDAIILAALDSGFKAQLAIDAGEGDDDVLLMLDGLHSDVTVSGGNPDTDHDTLTVIGTDGDDVFTVDKGASPEASIIDVGALDVSIEFSGIETLTIDAGAGDDDITVTALSSESDVGNVALIGGAGDDTFTVTPLAGATIEVLGGEGTDILIIDFGDGPFVALGGGSITFDADVEVVELITSGSFDMATTDAAGGLVAVLVFGFGPGDAPQTDDASLLLAGGDFTDTLIGGSGADVMLAGAVGGEVILPDDPEELRDFIDDDLLLSVLELAAVYGGIGDILFVEDPDGEDGDAVLTPDDEKLTLGELVQTLMFDSVTGVPLAGAVLRSNVVRRSRFDPDVTGETSAFGIVPDAGGQSDLLDLEALLGIDLTFGIVVYEDGGDDSASDATGGTTTLVFDAVSGEFGLLGGASGGTTGASFSVDGDDWVATNIDMDTLYGGGDLDLGAWAGDDAGGEGFWDGIAPDAEVDGWMIGGETSGEGGLISW